MNAIHRIPWLRLPPIAAGSAAAALATAIRLTSKSAPLDLTFWVVSAAGGMLGAALTILVGATICYVRERGLRNLLLHSVYSWCSVGLFGLAYPLLFGGSWQGYWRFLATGILLAPLIAVINHLPGLPSSEPSQDASCV